MNIKKQILEASRLLFNEKGVMNTTLRDVAKSMNKSYGNITYHFQTKEDVLFSLLDEMNKLKGEKYTNCFLKLAKLATENSNIQLMANEKLIELLNNKIEKL